MLRRWIALAVLATLTLGSLAYTGGYAWYLRSDVYRAECAAILSETLGLPSEIGSIIPRSRSSQEFRDVVVWLPEKRGRAHVCRSALLVRTPTDDDPNAHELHLDGGSSEISTRTWLRKDYRGVIESGLRPGFTPGGPRLVRFSGMNLAFERDRFRAELRDAAGYVSFDGDTEGSATIMCSEFNGVRVGEPVLMTARFSPHAEGIRMDELRLRVPELPLRITRMQELAGVELRSGRFRGELAYGESEGGRVLTVDGHCADVDLAEVTRGLLARPLRGKCLELEVRGLRIENRIPQRASVRGRLVDVHLADLLALIGLENVGGVATLDVGVADVSQAGIERFVASGVCSDVSLESLTSALGWGRASGTVRIQLDDLAIENNELRSLRATLVATGEVEDQWVEGELLRTLVSKALNFELPPVLPERIAYEKLGVRIEVQDERLYVFGTHGPRDATILTVKLLGRSVPLVPEPRESIDLRPWLEQLRAAREKISVPLPWPTTRPEESP